MEKSSRRDALHLLALGAAVLGPGQARAQQQAPPASRTAPDAPDATVLSVPPAELVNGTYEASFQEGYAPALLSVGFAENAVFRMFLSGSQKMSIRATDKALWLGTPREGAEQHIPLNVPVRTELFGLAIEDWLARFETPTLLTISFSAPNHARVQARQTFYPEGYVTRLSIEGGGSQFAPIRVWTRVTLQRGGKQPKGFLVPI